MVHPRYRGGYDPADDGHRNGGGAAITANEGQRRQWNDDVRLSAWRRREPMTAGVTAMLLEHAGLQAGEKVLDVGSGSARSAIAAAHQVGPLGEVVGADISERLVAVARQRTGAESVTNARFLVADVQTAVVDGSPFDVAISQFGVMFFDESVAAFANVRAHVRVGGRLAFVCWQTIADNPWFVGALLQPFCPAAPSPSLGKNATGPFTRPTRNTPGVSWWKPAGPPSSGVLSPNGNGRPRGFAGRRCVLGLLRGRRGPLG